eukprot:scaffold113980_cov24-Tisochrysis_lutea.AAC.8
MARVGVRAEGAPPRRSLSSGGGNGSSGCCCCHAQGCVRWRGGEAGVGKEQELRCGLLLILAPRLARVDGKLFESRVPKGSHRYAALGGRCIRPPRLLTRQTARPCAPHACRCLAATPRPRERLAGAARGSKSRRPAPTRAAAARAEMQRRFCPPWPSSGAAAVAHGCSTRAGPRRRSPRRNHVAPRPQGVARSPVFETR